jgi:hypothetical protein
MLHTRYGAALGQGETPDHSGTFIPLTLLTADVDRETDR